MDTYAYNLRDLEPVAINGGNKGVSLRLFCDDGLCRAKSMRVRAVQVAPGGQTDLHSHAWGHELIMLRGVGQLSGGEGARTLQPGDVLNIPAGQAHQLANTGAEQFEFLSIDYRR